MAIMVGVNGSPSHLSNNSINFSNIVDPPCNSFLKSRSTGNYTVEVAKIQSALPLEAPY